MIEIIWHGRGGQGAFTAAKLLGAAYVHRSDNSYALAFPSFGPERRGAPLRAYTKLDDKPILDRSEIQSADYILFLDDTLFTGESVNELKENGKILINTKKNIDDKRVIPFDGESIAMKILGTPISNTVMLSTFAMLFKSIDIQDVEKAIEYYMPSKIIDKNKRVVLEVKNTYRTEGII